MFFATYKINGIDGWTRINWRNQILAKFLSFRNWICHVLERSHLSWIKIKYFWVLIVYSKYRIVGNSICVQHTSTITTEIRHISQEYPTLGHFDRILWFLFLCFLDFLNVIGKTKDQEQTFFINDRIYSLKLIKLELNLHIRSYFLQRY